MKNYNEFIIINNLKKAVGVIGLVQHFICYNLKLIILHKYFHYLLQIIFKFS